MGTLYNIFLKENCRTNIFSFFFDRSIQKFYQFILRFQIASAAQAGQHS